MYTVQTCGVRFKPPVLIVTYIDNSTRKKRCRFIPIRKLKEKTNVSRIAEELKCTQRYRTLLSSVSQAQLERLLLVIQGHMKGHSVDKSLAEAKNILSVDPEEDLNLLGSQEIERAKVIMSESFESQRIRPGDANFQYDIEVDFGNTLKSKNDWDDDLDD